MNKGFKFLFITYSFFLIALNCSAWGFWAHRKINHQAVFTLPPSMIGFYKSHIDYLTTHAIDPDKRRYINKTEAPHHYISIDHYGEHPFDSIPLFWKDAVAKFTEDTLNAYGVVPWQIVITEYELTKAFKEHDIDKILYYSAFIGHYIADAHVPLHCALNYNGQKTNQLGIHAFWESRVPELFGDNFDYFTGVVHYIEKPQPEAWNIVRTSFNAVDSVLHFEAKLNDQFPSDKKFTYETRGNITQRVYSKEYSKAYSDMLDGMIERRMREAIVETGSFWYTAWVNAGSPDLKAMQNKDISEAMKRQLAEQDSLYKNGKLWEKDHCVE